MVSQAHWNRGGMRGIVELEVLRAIERELPVSIPVRSFFDLIVGTRFVQLISLLGPIKPRRRASFWFCGCNIISRHDLMSLSLLTRRLTRCCSTGGIIALGLGVEGWSIDECIDHFEKLCHTAFTAREFHGVWGLEQLSAFNHKYSKFKTKPLETLLKDAFSVSEQPLFGGKQNNFHSPVKVAVTSTTETGEQALLLTNYNRSHKNDHRGKSLFMIARCDT